MRLFNLAALAIFLVIATSSQTMADDSKTLRVGIIGLDTSHVPAFTKEFNQDPPAAAMHNCRVVAAYPYGSRDIESSASRIPKYTEQVKEMGLEVVEFPNTIDERAPRGYVVGAMINENGQYEAVAPRLFNAPAEAY